MLPPRPEQGSTAARHRARPKGPGMPQGTACGTGTGTEPGCSHLNKPIEEVLEWCFSQAGMRPVPCNGSVQPGQPA